MANDRYEGLLWNVNCTLLKRGGHSGSQHARPFLRTDSLCPNFTEPSFVFAAAPG